MKRDARIGLAILLVLGLAVTLLISRALFKRAEKAEQDRAAAAADHKGPDAPAAPRGPESSGPEVYGATQSPEDIELDRQLRAFTADHAPAGALAPTAGPGPASAAPPTEGTPPATPPGAGVAAAPPGSPAPSSAPAASATAPAAGAAPAAAAQSYAVVAGDNPWKISARVFGDGKYAQRIIQANPGVDAGRLKIGQKLVIPSVPGVTAKLPGVTAPAPTPATAATGAHSAAPSPAGPTPASASAAPTGAERTYTVKPGDTLVAIARSQLGSAGPKAVQQLVSANPGVDARHLKIGASLKVPAVAAAATPAARPAAAPSAPAASPAAPSGPVPASHALPPATAIPLSFD